MRAALAATVGIAAAVAVAARRFDRRPARRVVAEAEAIVLAEARRASMAKHPSRGKP